MATETLRPSAPGDETNNTPSGNGANWECVDEAVADDFTTRVYNGDSSTTKRDLYNIADSGVGTGVINKITVYIRVRDSNTAANNGFKEVIKSGTGTGAPDTVSEGALYECAAEDTWENTSNEWTTNPATSAAWTWDEIDKLQAGVSLIVDSGSLNCTQVYVVVDYTAAIDHEKSLSDSIAIAASIVKAPSLFRADTMAITDSFSYVRGLFKALSDTIAIADSFSYLQGFGLSKALADTIAITDSITTKAIGLFKADTVNVADAIKKTIGLIKADTMNITDAISKAVSIVKADTISIIDSFLHKIIRPGGTFKGGSITTAFLNAQIADLASRWEHPLARMRRLRKR